MTLGALAISAIVWATNSASFSERTESVMARMRMTSSRTPMAIVPA